MESGTVHLLSVDPDLGRFLTEEQFAVASRLRVPALSLDRGAIDVRGVLEHESAHTLLVLDAMIIQRVRLANHVTMTIHGPGDVIGRAAGRVSALLEDQSASAVTDTRIAVLGQEFLAGVRHFPGLAAGLQLRAAEQAERLTLQLAICQLPRVEDRLLALMWWLAETWGRVTSSGTLLPLTLTHDVLGALIGARRPTVTLAIGQLTQRGALVRQDRGWLLLEAPVVPDRELPVFDDPELHRELVSPWGARAAVEDEIVHAERAELLAYTHALRARQREIVSATGLRLYELREARERIVEARARRGSGAVVGGLHHHDRP